MTEKDPIKIIKSSKPWKNRQKYANSVIRINTVNFEYDIKQYIIGYIHKKHHSISAGSPKEAAIYNKVLCGWFERTALFGFVKYSNGR